MTTDDELRQLQERKRADLHLDANPQAIAPVELPCKVCGKGIACPHPHNGRIVAAWNDLAKEPPRFTCKECQENAHRQREQERREAEENSRQARLAAIRADLPGTLDGCGVPGHWLGASFDDCPDLPPDLVEQVRAWAQEPCGILYLYGPPGTGKTFLAVAVVRYVLQAGILPPATCRFLSEQGYLDGLKAAFNTDAAPVSPRLLPPNHLYRVGLLAYDDMAATRQTDWTRGVIAGLIEAHHATDLPTIITANIGLDALTQAIDGRVASRIAESRHILKFPDRDLRVGGTIRQAGKIFSESP